MSSGHDVAEVSTRSKVTRFDFPCTKYTDKQGSGSCRSFLTFRTRKNVFECFVKGKSILKTLDFSLTSSESFMILFVILTPPMFPLGTVFINVYMFSPPEFEESEAEVCKMFSM